MIRSVVAAVGDAGIRVQCGGGVRSRESAAALYDSGVTRCVVGTAAVENPDLVTELAAAGHRVAVGLDVRGTEVATRGWKRRSGVSLSEALARLAGSGAEAVVVTQIARDGMGSGSDLAGLGDVLDAPQRPPAMSVIASGGVGCLADIADLRDLRSAHGHTLAGAIVGKALHDGAISPAAAVVVARGSTAHDEPDSGSPNEHGRRTADDSMKGRLMKTVRVIPCLDVDDGRVVKGVNFLGLRDAGDPVELAAAYDRQGADEVVFLDITASAHGRDTIIGSPAHTAEEVFIPFTIGGGIRSVDDARALLRAGADKVSVNSAAVARPELVREIADEFGSQCVVVSVDAKANDPGLDGSSTWNVYVKGGREDTGLDALSWVRQVADLGAGEILLTSMDADGTKAGFDLELTRAVVDAVSIPVVASGGVGTLQHLVDGAVVAGADAVLAASIFHFGEHTIADAKQALMDAGVTVRPPGH